MTLVDILAIAVSTTVLVGAVMGAMWVWFSYKSRGPLGALEKRLREDFHSRFARMENRADERHDTLLKKMERIDEDVVKALDRSIEAKELAVRAEGLARTALRDLDKRNRT